MALNEKRMQTFFNEFLVTTTSFLNQFASDCENKFLSFERKLNKIESNLLIIEQKLASVPSNEEKVPNLPDIVSLEHPEAPVVSADVLVEPVSIPPTILEQKESASEHAEVNDNLIKICESALYRKYFTMLKVKVPVEGVKQKMSSEGVDSSLLDNPELMINRTPEDNKQ